VADKIEKRFNKIMESLDNAKRLALEENRKHFEMHDSHLRGLFSSVERDLAAWLMTNTYLTPLNDMFAVRSGGHASEGVGTGAQASPISMGGIDAEQGVATTAGREEGWSHRGGAQAQGPSYASVAAQSGSLLNIL
jgi:hypothetical protein